MRSGCGRRSGIMRGRAKARHDLRRPRRPAPREAVFPVLADPGNHWALADAAIEVLTLERSGGPGTPADGGHVRLRGPLGIRRTVVTRVDVVEEPVTLAGTALVGDRTRARVRWDLEDAGAGATRVTLQAV